MSEYKEFWIQPSKMIAHDSKPPIVQECFHVIEYSAYEKANARIKELESKCDLLNELLLENKLLKNQLCFTNSSWPHEKHLHEKIEQLKSDNEKLQSQVDVMREAMTKLYF